MGLASSKQLHSANDFELVIRSAKELEHILRQRFHAEGNGVNEMLDSISGEHLPVSLVKKMRHLIWVRNQLVHNHEVNSIPGNRENFIRDFEESVSELNDILAKKEGGGSGSSCVVS